MSVPSVTIIIPNYNDAATLVAAIEGVLAHTHYPDWELVVVDDGSTDDSVERLRRFRQVRVIRQTHAGVARALNAGFAAAGRRDVVRLHADVVVETADWLTRLVDAAYGELRAGVVGVRLVYPDGRIQSEGRHLMSGVGLHPGHRDRRAFEAEGGPTGRAIEVDGVAGALAYYRREVVDAVGGLAEGYGPVWTEDDDFCVAARVQGFKVYVQPAVTAVHYTRAWSPTSVVQVGGAESLVGLVTWQAKREVQAGHAAHWEARWGWHPYYPDLQEIRRLYGHTELCWRIGEPLRWRPTVDQPTVDCCLVTWNNQALLDRCLQSLAATDYPRERLRVYVADNASTDGTPEYLEALAARYPFPMTVSRLAVNTGAAVGLNWAVAQGQGELVARLDDDIILPPSWLKRMVDDLRRRPYAGVVGPKILNDDAERTIQCGAYRHFPGLFGHEDEPDLGQADYLARATHVRGCCNLYRRDVFARCGLFDVRYSPSQFDDPDHHIALAVAGYEILYDGRVGVVHKLNTGIARSHAAVANQRANAGKMYGKWGKDIWEVLEKSIELSREGRYLPDDLQTPAGEGCPGAEGDYPRRVQRAPSGADALGHRVNEELCRARENPRLQMLVQEHLAQAAIQRRDGYPRQAMDTLHTVANFAPEDPEVWHALAETYRLAGQPWTAGLLARRGLHLAPQHAGLREVERVLNARVKPTDERVDGAARVEARANRPNDRSDEIGEARVSVNVRGRRQGSAARMRVLMVNSFENRVAGGDMHQVKKTKQYLEQLGVEVDLCCTPRPDPRGYDVVHAWNLWFPHQTLAQLKVVRWLAPDVPIVLSPIYWDMAEKAWADVAVPQLFGTAGGPAELEERLNQLAADKLQVNGRSRSNAPEPNYPGYELYQKRVLELVDHLLPQSHAEMRNLQRTLDVEKPFTLVRNSAETAVFEAATADWFWGRYRQKDFVLTVGLVEPRKNQLMLLQALREAGLPVVVIGRHYDRNYHRLCHRHAPAGTLFIEHLPHEHLASAFKAARVHALPSWMECAAFANIEAAASGCSLAVSNRTSEQEYFGENAYYCDPADVRSIRDAVVRAWQHHEEDAGKRQTLRELFQQRYTWRHAAEQTLRGYELALASHAGGGGRQLSTPAVPVAAPEGAAGSPEVTVVIPVFNRVDLTQRCLAALERTTSMGRIEMVIVDNGSTDGTAGFLAGLTPGRPWLRVITHPANAGFAAACNQGARASQAPLLLFLNNDTEPQAGWLESLLVLVHSDPGVVGVGSRLLYADGTVQHAGVALFDDAIHGDPLQARHLGVRQPGESPEVLRSREFPALTAACLLVRRKAFEAAGGFDEGYWNGYEDVDLCLKLREGGGRLVYQPRSVLVHHESQSGPERYAKVRENVARFHARWLGKARPDFRVAPGGAILPVEGSVIREYLPREKTAEPVASVVILTLNQLSHTRACVESLLAHTAERHELIMVDNGSQDGTVDYLQGLARQHARVRLILNRTNRGFAAGNNQALALARGDYGVLLNNDTVVTAGWLERMLSVAERRPQLGLLGPMTNRAVGPQVVPEGSYPGREGLAAFAASWAADHAGEIQATTRLVGFCLMVRRAVWERIGGLDESFGSGNFEDDDYCWRARFSGFEAALVREVFIHHTGSQTFQGERMDYRAAMVRNWDLFKRKWGLAPELPLERGYPAPTRVPEGMSLRVALPRLETSHVPDAAGRCWTERGRSKAATARVELPSTAWIGHLGPAREAVGQGRPKEAWDRACEALRERPFHPEAWLVLAEAARAGGDAGLARRCVESARRQAPAWKPAKRLANQLHVRGAARKLDWRVPEASGQGLRLSVCLIVRNEEKFLRQCLESIRAVAHQIVVVDTGSTDRTMAIARECGAEVHEFAWVEDFSAARNAALEHARGDWVLVLDADEELPAESHGRIQRLMRVAEVMAWRLPITDVGREAQGCSYVPRLFRNAPGLFFVGRVHEQVFSSVEVRRKEWGLENRLGDAVLRHHGYTEEVVRERGKVERNLRLLQRAVEEYPEDAALRMNLGLETVRSGAVREGLEHYREAFRIMSAEPADRVVPETREMLLSHLATQLVAVKAHAELAAVLTSPLARAGGLTASLHFALGLAYLEMGQSTEAAEQMRQCLAKRDQPALAPINAEIRRAGPRHCLALCLARTGEAAAAREEFQRVMREHPEAHAVRLDYARFLAAAGEAVEALQLLHGVTLEKPDETVAWTLGATIALSRPDFQEVALDWTAEASRNLPEEPLVRRQRAEALLLSGQCALSLMLWRSLDRPGPEEQAAQVLCELVAGGNGWVPAAQLEGEVSQHFLKWYQRLVEFGANDAVLGVNQRVEELRPRLPTAARALGSALQEAACAVA